MYPVTPGTPDSTGLVISAGSSAANGRRNKSLMNSLRDRTPGYTRPTINRQRYEYERNCNILPTKTLNGRPEGIGGGADGGFVYLKEPPLPRASRPVKLALLKSSSTRDLSRLLEESSSPTSFAFAAVSPSSNSSLNAAAAMATHCNDQCLKRMQDLEQRLLLLEKDSIDQRTYTKDLELKVIELTKRLAEYQSEADKQSDAKQRIKASFRKKQPTGPSSVQPSKLVAWMNLSNLWKHRPSIATLKEQNIYNDEPCFDTEIEMVLKHETHTTVPKIVVDCCDLIEEKFHTSPCIIEGIYRQCGDYNKIQTLRFSIDANNYGALRQPKIDIHTLTGVLKLFLREIKSPLVRTNEVKTFIGKPNVWLLTEQSQKIETLQRLIRSLPEINRDTMQYLFTHFHKLTKIPLQSVSAEILSLSVTPPIFHTVQQGVHMQDIHELLREGEVMADCVRIMIEYHSKIFECTADQRRPFIDMRKLRKTLSHPDLLFENIF